MAKYQDNVNGNPDFDSDDVLKEFKVNGADGFKVVRFGVRCIAVATIITPEGEEIQVETDADNADDEVSDHVGAIQFELRKKI